MPRSLLAVVLLAGLLMGVVGLLLLVFVPGGTSDPAAAIPAHAEAALIIPSVPKLLRDFEATRMAPAHGSTGWDVVASLIEELLQARGIDYQPDAGLLGRNLRGGAALAWVPSENPAAPARLVFAFEIPRTSGDSLAAVEREILPALVAQGATWRRRSHRGHDYGTLRVTGSADILCVTTYGRLAIVTVSGETMRQSLASLMRREPSLARDQAFRRIRNDLPSRSDLVAWLAPGALARARSEGHAAGDRWAGLLAAARDLRGIGVSVNVTRQGLFRETLRVMAPGFSRSIPGEVFSSRPRRLSVPEVLPAGYPFYLAVSFGDASALWKRMPEWLGPLLRLEQERIQARLQGLEQFLGTDVRSELVETLGEEAALAWDPAGALPAVAAVRPAEETAARRVLARLDGLARAAEAYQAFETPAGSVVTYAHAALAAHRPSYAFREGILLLADAPEPLLEILREPLRPARSKTDARADGPPRFFSETKAHAAVVAETGSLIAWVRDLSRGTPAGPRERAWLERLRDLLPGSAGPLPASKASFRILRDGLSGEWTSPLSPVVMVALMTALAPAPAPPGESAGEAMQGKAPAQPATAPVTPAPAATPAPSSPTATPPS